MFSRVRSRQECRRSDRKRDLSHRESELELIQCYEAFDNIEPMTKGEGEVKSLLIIGTRGYGRIVAETAAVSGNFQVSFARASEHHRA